MNMQSYQEQQTIHELEEMGFDLAQILQIYPKFKGDKAKMIQYLLGSK